MTNQDRMVFILGLSAACYIAALGLGYFWVRAMHYPFTLRQRKMWNYYVLIISALPVLAPFMVAMGLWMLSPAGSMAVSISLLVIWIVISILLVRRMSKPGGRLSEEREE